VTSNDDGALDDRRFHADTPVCCTQATYEQKNRASLWPAKKKAGALQKSHRLMHGCYDPKRVLNFSVRDVAK
jgi:hypothetical protein